MATYFLAKWIVQIVAHDLLFVGTINPPVLNLNHYTSTLLLRKPFHSLPLSTFMSFSWDNLIFKALFSPGTKMHFWWFLVFKLCATWVWIHIFCWLRHYCERDVRCDKIRKEALIEIWTQVVTVDKFENHVSFQVSNSIASQLTTCTKNASNTRLK